MSDLAQDVVVTLNQRHNNILPSALLSLRFSDNVTDRHCYFKVVVGPTEKNMLQPVWNILQSTSPMNILMTLQQRLYCKK